MLFRSKPPKLILLKPHIENLIKSTKKYGIRKINLKNIIKDLVNKNSLYKGPDNLFRIALNKKLISVSIRKRLKKHQVPIAVNFTQAAGVVLKDLLESKNNGEMGEILGVDIIVTYPSWPRQWQKEADWLRFKKEGGMTREVISHFLFLLNVY